MRDLCTLLASVRVWKLNWLHLENINEAGTSAMASEAKRGSLDTVVLDGTSINEAKKEDLCILWRSTKKGWRIIQENMNIACYNKSLGEELPSNILLERKV